MSLLSSDVSCFDGIKNVVNMVADVHHPLAKSWVGVMVCSECNQLYPCQTVQVCEKMLDRRGF